MSIHYCLTTKTSPNPKTKVEDVGNNYNVYIDDNFVAGREKNNPNLLRNIIYV